MGNSSNEMVVLQGTSFGPHGSDPGALTLRQAVSAIFRSKWLLFSMALAGMLIGAFIGLSKPNTFVSQGSFLFRPGGEQIVLDPVATATEAVQRPLRSNAEAIVKSEEVLRRTVRRLGPSYVLAPYQPSLGPNEQGGFKNRVRGWLYSVQRALHAPKNPVYKESTALIALQNTLAISSPTQSQLLRCNVMANDPERAKKILEVFMEEAQKRHLEVYSAEQSIQEIGSAYEVTKTRHQEHKKKIKQFLAAHDLQDYDTDLKEAQADARTTRGIVTDLRNLLKTNRTTLIGLKERLAHLEPTVTVTSHVPIPNERVPVLRTHIGQVEAELLTKQRVLRPTDESIKNLQRQLKRLKNDLDKELAKKVETRTETREEPNQEYLATKQNISQIQLQLVIDEERLPGLEQRAKQARQEAERISRLQSSYREMDRNVTRSATDLDNAEQLLALARKKSELDRKRITSLAVLDHPNLPIVKEGPQRARIVIGGILAGILLAIALVIIGALTDTTIRSVEELEDIASVRVLATIPNLDRVSVKRHRTKRVTSWS